MLLFHDEAVQTLICLGVTSVQARVYLALVRSGLSTVKTISKVSNVARQDIYRIMTVLQRLGLAEKAVSRPLMFKAVPIDDAVSILMESRMKETCQLQVKATKLIKNFKSTAEVALQTDGPQLILIPKQEVLRETARQFENARMSIDGITSLKKFFPWVPIGAKLYEKALKRGVNIRLITDKPEDEKSLPEVVQDLKKNPHLEIKYVQTAPQASMELYDEKVAYVNTSATSGLAETPCYCTNNPSLLAIFQDYFEILWLTAIE